MLKSISVFTVIVSLFLASCQPTKKTTLFHPVHFEQDINEMIHLKELDSNQALVLKVYIHTQLIKGIDISQFTYEQLQSQSQFQQLNSK